MEERIYAKELPDGRTFRCVESQLAKKGYRCPVSKKKLNRQTFEEVDEVAQ